MLYLLHHEKLVFIISLKYQFKPGNKEEIFILKTNVICAEKSLLLYGLKIRVKIDKM